MKRYYQFDLYKYNTMRLHCIADEVFVPESMSEVVDFVKENVNYVLLAGGSNVILPKVLHRSVLSFHELQGKIAFDGKIVLCDSSVRIQRLIREMRSKGLGGIEYLYSVPCTVGGAVYMNAGRGEIFHQSISDHILEVECWNLESGTKEVLTKDECQFGYRRSVFHEGKRIILSVVLAMDICPYYEVEQKINERLQYSNNFLDASKPSCGSVFLRCDPQIMRKLKGFRIGGACWSRKTENWISNDRNAKNRDVILLIRMAQLLHKLFRKQCCREVILIKKR